MKKHVLLVEDARDVQELVQFAIKDVCDLSLAETTADPRKKIFGDDYSLIVLDVNLPDAFNLCKDLREEKRFEYIPIIILTSEDRIESKIQGFEVGADDYITKPFHAEELRARVLGRLRRSKKVDTIFKVGPYIIDLNLQKIREEQPSGVRSLNLTPIEFKLLVLFLRNLGKIYSRQELLDMFWGGNVYVSRHTVDTHISSLRKKMGPSGECLKSVFKRGYRLTFPIEKEQDQIQAAI